MALQGVALQTPPLRFPEANGMAIRFNWTIQDKTRTIMIDAYLPAFLWAEILQATNLLRNMTLVTHLSYTPFEKWNGRKPGLSKLRVLGCNVMLYYIVYGSHVSTHHT